MVQVLEAKAMAIYQFLIGIQQKSQRRFDIVRFYELIGNAKKVQSPQTWN